VTASPAKTWLERDGALLRLRLARPKANVLDAGMIAALDEVLERHLDLADLRAVLLDAEGPHFSFGASVEEHLPAHCADMLKAFHRLVLRLVESPVPVLAAVSGQCLGGGLELAMAGHLVFAGRDAKFGQPEITLGVFAPAASCLLPARIGRANAEDLLLSGRSIDSAEALAIGLVNAVDDDPGQAALDYYDRHLAGKSASSLRYAVEAARTGFAAQVRERIAAVERLYLSRLMETRDAVEGLNAFLEKRAAQWENR
jgi:cyclohexa-1,5-dienecarbonyl-CoA hydratase